jgi:histone acetyltransferase (RNA polymerase elongator complex component)
VKQANVALFVPHLGCPHRCSFCDQNTVSGAQTLPTPQDVRDACRTALAHRAAARLELAFFGGSFTAVDAPYREALLDAAQEFLGRGIDGIRVSTRPDAADDAILAHIKRRGVCAVELGAQSMDDDVLRKNLRGHTAQDVREASARVLAQGMELGLQMMIGLDGEQETGAEETARALIACRPDTVRIYPTLVLKNTQLAERMHRGLYRPLSLAQAVERTARVMEMFERQNIRIIRVGLHQSDALARGVVAGPAHPAFRELCESRLMLERLLAQVACRPPGRLTVSVRPQDVSRMIGQRRQNAAALAERGFALSVRPDALAKPLYPRAE